MSTRKALLFASIAVFCMGASDAGGGTDVVGILREFGFPIFVSLWFMWRVEKRMDKFTEAIQNLLTAVTIMAKTVDDLTPHHAYRRAPPTLPSPPG